ncbi:formyltransferase family protein [Kitasatospora sp. NBC_01287]|uniref:formyltransferase family protein n=1 Tax=Kitasatospora sp. NBC_01287 TaxID=2903573 RepID=UPI00224E5BC7|nr:formyltransferase family protein [Kitasatospora sp. NBC_01287]MCX4745127.1 formyltransferase family protein [Kitasatospora sp. NBC_01287]
MTAPPAAAPTPGPAPQRVLFWASKQLGLRCFAHLAELAAGRPDAAIAGLVHSDRDHRKSGRARNELVELARDLGVPVFDEHQDPVGTDATIGIAVGYPHRITPRALARCQRGALNLHMAPLPHYRGSKTLAHAIINGEERCGVSLHYMDAGLDTGDVIAVRWIPIPPTGPERQIMTELAETAFDLFTEYAPRLLDPEPIPATPQSVLEEQGGVVPRRCTRASLAALYELSHGWDFERLYRYARALDTGNGKLPYIEDGGRRIYLQVAPGPPSTAHETEPTP